MNSETAPPIPARIVLIDDDLSINVLLNLFLERNVKPGVFVIDYAPTPELGLARVEGAACILLDLTIPAKRPGERDWRPEETLKLIPELREKAPVIVLTGYSRGSDQEDAAFAADVVADMGADMVFFKPTLMTPEGVGWLFTAITAAVARRLYVRKVAKTAAAA